MEMAVWNRISYKGRLEDISENICRDFRLGKLVSNKIVTVGYDDFNFVLQTDKGKYFVKVFSKFRSLKDCKRYVHIIESSRAAGVSVPKLFRAKQGYLYSLKLGKSILHLCVMKYIDGKSLYNLDKSLSNYDIVFLANQASIINSIRLKPGFIYDHWAITNFYKEFKEKRKYLSKSDMKLIEPLVNEFKKIKIKSLPHTFVHGDITKTNIIRDEKNKLWIVDFSIANYYPRIQELAVLACNVLFDKNDKSISETNLNLALREYEKKYTTHEKRKTSTASIYRTGAWDVYTVR